MKKKILYRSRSEAESFKEKLKAACPDIYMNIYVQRGKYAVMVSGTCTDAEIQKALGPGRIVESDSSS